MKPEELVVGRNYNYKTRPLQMSSFFYVGISKDPDIQGDAYNFSFSNNRGGIILERCQLEQIEEVDLYNL